MWGTGATVCLGRNISLLTEYTHIHMCILLTMFKKNTALKTFQTQRHFEGFPFIRLYYCAW